ncbi:hypothetical protein pdam_00024291, partial [Pocillopora damicornis]
DFGVFDFRVDIEGNPFLLECNLFCSFGPQSVVNIIAKDSGFTDETSQGEDTKAVRLVKDSKLLNAAIEHALSYSDHVIIESYIEGREIRRAVVESAANGELKALSCIEYKVRENDIRRTEDKLSCNEKGLPVGKYWRYMSLIPTTTLAINISATKPHFQGVVRLIGFTVQKFLNPK